MCLFTHFAVGALAGGLCGQPVIGAVAGIASHALLDMIPHYDHPDWRVELLGGAGALVLLLLLPFGNLAAVLGGLGGMLPDLENLFQKLGWYSRSRFIFPTHNGILPHGRRLPRGSLRWQVAIFAASYVALGLFSAAPAAAEPTERAVLGQAGITVLDSGTDRTVVRIRVPALTVPEDWNAVASDRIQWGDPMTVDDQAPVAERFAAPRRNFVLAVPSLARPAVVIRSIRWWREPDSPVNPLFVAEPRVFRSVPLLGCRVDLGAGGGILAEVVVEITHVRQDEFAEFLGLADKQAAGYVPGLVVPHGLLNPSLFRDLGSGARAKALQDRSRKGGDDPRPGPRFSDTGNWLRLDVRDNGPMRLTGAELSGMGVPVTAVDPDKLRLFRGGGMALDPDPTLSDTEQADRVGLQEVAIAVRDGGDQEWNLDDDLLFYAVASSTWRDRFPGAAERLEYYDHPFADHATYWLTWEDAGTPSPWTGVPLRMAVEQPAVTGGPQVSNARVRLHREKQLLDDGGLFQDNWAWDSFVISSRPDTFTLRHPAAGSAARFVVDVRGNYFSIRVDYPFRAEAWLNGNEGEKAALDFLSSDQTDPDSMRVRVVGSSTSIYDGLNTLTLANASQSFGSVPKQSIALDSFDISYIAELDLQPGAEALETIFASGEPGMPAQPFDIRIQAPGAADFAVWDVTDPRLPRMLGVQRDAQDPDVWLVGYDLSDALDHQLVLIRDGAYGQVAGGQVAHPRELRADPVDLDYLVVYASEFEFAGTTLAAYRNTTLPGIAQPAAAAVSAADIYDNFAGGQKDPRAIRNYLRWVYEQGGHRLQYACFVGNASRDYRNYLDHPVGQGLYDFLPTEVRTVFPEFPTTGSSATPYASDDGLVSFDYYGSGVLDFPDLACGRLPASTGAEALDMVTRSMAYDGDPEPGVWRNRVVFVADDANRPDYGQNPLVSEIYHTVQSEVLTEEYLPTSLDVTKIYGVAYPFPSPTSNVKPQMANDIKATLTEGTTIFHYIGHGSEDNLADEQVFLSRDIPNLLNGMKRLVFVAFSCDVGIYDSPNRWSMAEQFLTSSSGGAMACITASQVSYSLSNNTMSNAFYEELYPGRRVAADQTIGLALMEAKSLMVGDFDTRNSQHFNIMGEPALSLPNPPDILTFAPGSVDTLRTGTRQVVVMAADGQDPPAPGDSYDIRVEDSGFDQAYVVNYVSGNPTPPPLYIYTPTERYFHHKGASVFRGTGIDDAAALEIPFINPVQYRYGDDARIRIIVTGGGTERAGVMRLSSLRGSGSTGNDVEGPLIRLAFQDGRYRVRSGSLLTAELADSSGIAILGTSPGNSLLLEFDDSGFMTDVTGSFTFDQNSYTAGRLSFPLPGDLDLGSHRAALHASDALGNVGSDTLSFQLIPQGVRGLENVTLFPNPTPGPCRLLFDLSDPMTVQWEIYTLAGRRLKTIRQDFATSGPVIMAWGGRDERGDEIANGTYLFVLRGFATTADEREITKTGKLVVMR